MTFRAVLRLLDANANRALEGLRVTEDIVRLGWEQAGATRRCRTLRHALTGALRRLPVSRAALLEARATRRDPGRTSPGSPVGSLDRLLTINLQRAKEALRVLEECSRLVAPRQAGEFQRLRFRTYDLERHLMLCLAAVRHPRPRRRRPTRSR